MRQFPVNQTDSGQSRNSGSISEPEGIVSPRFGERQALTAGIRRIDVSRRTGEAAFWTYVIRSEIRNRDLRRKFLQQRLICQEFPIDSKI